MRLEALKVQQQQFVAAPPKFRPVAGDRGAVEASQAGSLIRRVCRREDFVPNCVEELQEWIGGRQAGLLGALVAGCGIKKLQSLPCCPR